MAGAFGWEWALNLNRASNSHGSYVASTTRYFPLARPFKSNSTRCPATKGEVMYECNLYMYIRMCMYIYTYTFICI